MAADGGRAAAACSHRSGWTASARPSSWLQRERSPPGPVSGAGSLLPCGLSETSALLPQKTRSAMDEGPCLCPPPTRTPEWGLLCSAAQGVLGT